MTSEGAIFDLDYRRYEGKRTSRTAIRWSIVRDGVRRILGLRRKARRKILPWGLILIAILPAIVNVGFQVLAEGLFGADEILDELLISHSDYFGITFGVTLLFVALATPELMIPDRVHNVLTVYGSRPLTVADYLVARVGALFILVMVYSLLPQLILYVGGAILSGDAVGHITGNLDLLWQVPVGAVAIFASQTSIALIISAFVRRVGFAAGIYIALSLITFSIADALADASSRWFALLSLQDHAQLLISRIFNEPEISADGPLAMNHISPWVSVVFIAALAVAAGAFLMRRYRKLI
jgi:ABC-2 type transport system permease protein